MYGRLLSPGNLFVNGCCTGINRTAKFRCFCEHVNRHHAAEYLFTQRRRESVKTFLFDHGTPAVFSLVDHTKKRDKKLPVAILLFCVIRFQQVTQLIAERPRYRVGA